MKGVNAVRTWWSGTSSAAGDAATTAADFLKNLVGQPGEVITDASELFADTSVEDLFVVVLVARMHRRDGTNCTLNCTGAVFNSFSTYDSLANLYHSLDGSIYSLNATNLLTRATRDSASIFSGINNYLFGDSRGRILHGYKDEVERHGVSRSRLSDINFLPSTSMLMYVPVDLRLFSKTAQTDDVAVTSYQLKILPPAVRG